MVSYNFCTVNRSSILQLVLVHIGPVALVHGALASQTPPKPWRPSHGPAMCDPGAAMPARESLNIDAQTNSVRGIVALQQTPSFPIRFISFRQNFPTFNSPKRSQRPVLGLDHHRNMEPRIAAKGLKGSQFQKIDNRSSASASTAASVDRDTVPEASRWPWKMKRRDTSLPRGWEEIARRRGMHKRKTSGCGLGTERMGG